MTTPPTYEELQRDNKNLRERLLRLQESEQRYRSILENSTEGYFELDRSTRVIFGNPAFCVMLGLPFTALTKTNLLELAAPEESPQLKSLVERIIGGRMATATGAFAFPEAEGAPVTLELSLSPISTSAGEITGIRGMARNISALLAAEEQRKQLERQLNQAQKLESIGTLAGGIAHDFNNILFIIQGYTDLALVDLQKQRDPAERLTKVKAACSRATDLIDQILSFARHSERQRQPIDIRPTLKESIKLLRSVLPSTIGMTHEIQLADDSYILADPSEIHQVIMNLCTNAGQAMKGMNGTLTLSAQDVNIDEDFLQSRRSAIKLTAGRHVLLSISDTGRGMAPAHLSRIFEPFYTTKNVGEGSGLGLSVVHGLITGMNGAITVTSTEGSGTTFAIYLPVTSKFQATQQGSPVQQLPKGNGEHVLLVDDDQVLLGMVASMLAELNYRCTPCGNGSEAFELFNREPLHFDLLLTDQTMPGLTGEALSLAVRLVRPDMPIVLCTGFSEQMGTKRAEEIGIDVYLPKPILMESLSHALRDALHR